VGAAAEGIAERSSGFRETFDAASGGVESVPARTVGLLDVGAGASEPTSMGRDAFPSGCFGLRRFALPTASPRAAPELLIRAGAIEVRSAALSVDVSKISPRSGSAASASSVSESPPTESATALVRSARPTASLTTTSGSGNASPLAARTGTGSARTNPSSVPNQRPGNGRASLICRNKTPCLHEHANFGPS
jgi:hypothetical protein